VEVDLGDLKQELQLVELMGQLDSNVSIIGSQIMYEPAFGSQSVNASSFTSDSKIDGDLGIQDSAGDLEITPKLSAARIPMASGTKDLNHTVMDKGFGVVSDNNSMDVESWKTPEIEYKVDSDCFIVGNKFHSLISDESHHSKWEEFRNLAREGVSDECSRLLKKMELEDSDEEYDLLDVENEVVMTMHDEEKKPQKRKQKWGPIERIPRPRRVPDDGHTVLQKAQGLKAIRNLEKGKTTKSFAFESNSELLRKAQCVNINLGKDSVTVNEVIDNLKKIEIKTCEKFKEDNPEVTLPGNLDIENLAHEFPPLNGVATISSKNNDMLVNQPWARVVSTDTSPNNNQTFKQ
jgi:hypothetical protein